MMAPSSSNPPSHVKLTTGEQKLKSRSKPCPTAFMPNSASSTSVAAASLLPGKRTREQPNFSNCHCCGHRINSTNPKDRLQPIESFWRIVLLCRKCHRNVHSGQMCLYCFQETGNSGEFFTCSVCERIIHGDCVSNYYNCMPWCYLSVGLEEFSVCADCWVPELLKTSVRVSKWNKNKVRMKENGGEREVEKKVRSMAKVEKKNMEDWESLKSHNLNCSSTVKVADAVKLAIPLHRAINSSLRNLRGKSLATSSSDLDISSIKNTSVNTEDQNLRTCASNVQNERMTRAGGIDSRLNSSLLTRGLLYYKRDKNRKIWMLIQDNAAVSEGCNFSLLTRGLLYYKRDKNRKIWMLIQDSGAVSEAMRRQQDIVVSEASICGTADRNSVDRFGKELLCYKRSGSKRKVFQESGVVGVSGESNSLVSPRGSFKPEFSQMDDGGFRIGCQDKSDDIEVISPSGSCKVDGDWYLLKYGRRLSGTKSVSGFQCFYNLLSQNQCSLHDFDKFETGLNKYCDRNPLKSAKRYKRT